MEGGPGRKRAAGGDGGVSRGVYSEEEGEERKRKPDWVLEI